MILKQKTMKTKILQITLTLALMLIASNTYADGTKGSNKEKSVKAKTSKIINKLDSAFEQELSLEGWMTEVSAFSTNEVFFEEELTLEAWMMNDFSETSENLNFDKELELEEWMLTTSNFNDEFIEEELQFEDWMFQIK